MFRFVYAHMILNHVCNETVKLNGDSSWRKRYKTFDLFHVTLSHFIYSDMRTDLTFSSSGYQISFSLVPVNRTFSHSPLSKSPMSFQWVSELWCVLPHPSLAILLSTIIDDALDESKGLLLSTLDESEKLALSTRKSKASCPCTIWMLVGPHGWLSVQSMLSNYSLNAGRATWLTFCPQHLVQVLFECW